MSKRVTPFAIGDRVRVYDTAGHIDGTVCGVDGDFLKISLPGFSVCPRYHQKQVRRLKSKKDGVRITRKMLDEAWTAFVNVYYLRADVVGPGLQFLYKALGLAEPEKKE